MKRRFLAAVVPALTLAAGGCATGGPDTSAATAPSPPTSATARSAAGNAPSRTASAQAAPRPRFADLTQGSTTSVVRLHGYDPRNASAVAEPMIFMTGDAYCRTFKIKRTDGRCTHLAYVTEESHTRVTVPIAPTVKYYTWEDPQGDVCIDAPEKGGTCPMTAEQFAEWYELNKKAMVAVATQDGAITRMAIVYTP
ncbi:hypothetical protein [Actinoplanes sp. M2I2]|uniref:hypothetical protein n=1 Tax=Actinoplanes sp. M2I2 TaxID=1734444 RepID=UPI0020209C6F|nr:hypothetical protein [Actinoplanes sp. M2I2]